MDSVFKRNKTNLKIKSNCSLDPSINNKNAFLLILSLVLLFTLITNVIVILDPRVKYSTDLVQANIGFLILISLLTLSLFYIYFFKYVGYPKITITLFLATSIYLLYFGIVSIHVDEVIDKSPLNSYYLKLKNEDDNIAIYSIIVGFMVLMMCIYGFMII